jgi:cell division septation protein DedD
MDQNSSNGSGKTNWREKLGIGNNAKELPKISDEFKPAGPAGNSSRPQRVEPKIVSRPAPRAPHVVAKPAPMAPRPAAQAAPPPPPPPPAAEPKSESLAERLKSQRQAAERLAEQRITAVRASVKDGKTAPVPAAKAAEAAKAKPLAAPSPDAPKFSFAEEELASAKADTTARDTRRQYTPAYQPTATPASSAVPPLVPPRPALGGEKPLIPPAKQEPVGYSGTQPGGGYRPLDPPPYQQRPASAVPPRTGYGEAAAGDVRQPPGARFDGIRRPPAGRLGVEAGEPSLPLDDIQRGRRPLPPRSKRPASYDDDLGEVFEDEEAAPPPRRRAKAQDYSQAYREYEDTYEEDERRSSGPWLLLLALLALAALAFGGIWYYSKFMAPQGGATQTGETAPVVPAPATTDKTIPQPEPEITQGALNPEPAPAMKKKIIYDRILGDQAIEGGTMVPTEEAPTQVQPTQDQSQQPVPAAGPPENQGLQPSQGQAVEPPQPNAPTNTQTIDPAVNGGTGQEPLPLPVPPTPGSNPNEGSLTPANGQQQSNVAVVQPTVSPASTTSQETDPAGSTSSETGAAANQQPAVQQQEPSAELIEEPITPVKQKAKAVEAPAKAKKKAKAVAQKQKSKDPVVLVPPPDSGSDQAVAAEPTPGTGSGSFFGSGNSRTASRPNSKGDDKVFNAARTNFSAKQPDQGEALAADTQVASVEPAEPQPAAKPEERSSTSSRSGYVAQLASFRSEAEALSEFDRLKGKHGGILGGKAPRVSKGTVGGTTRYRLGVGPMASKDEASKLCNSLIASGERDCIVRQQ